MDGLEITPEQKLEAIRELLNSMQNLIDNGAVLRRDLYDYAEGLRGILDA